MDLPIRSQEQTGRILKLRAERMIMTRRTVGYRIYHPGTPYGYPQAIWILGPFDSGAQEVIMNILRSDDGEN